MTACVNWLMPSGTFNLISRHVHHICWNSYIHSACEFMPNLFKAKFCTSLVHFPSWPTSFLNIVFIFIEKYNCMVPLLCTEIDSIKLYIMENKINPSLWAWYQFKDYPNSSYAVLIWRLFQKKKKIKKGDRNSHTDD